MGSQSKFGITARRWPLRPSARARPQFELAETAGVEKRAEADAARAQAEVRRSQRGILAAINRRLDESFGGVVDNPHGRPLERRSEASRPFVVADADAVAAVNVEHAVVHRSEEHTSELQSL